jgi:hypothetical protein
MILFMCMLGMLARQAESLTVFGQVSQWNQATPFSSLVESPRGSTIHGIRVNGFIRGDWEGLLLFQTQESCQSLQGVAIGLSLKWTSLKNEAIASPRCAAVTVEADYSSSPPDKVRPLTITIGPSFYLFNVTYLSKP